MQNASDASDDSSDNADLNLADNSSSSSNESWHRDSDCICGGDDSYSDWNDINCDESKRAKLEINRFFSSHKQLHRAIRLHDCRMIRQLLDDGIQPCTKYKNSSNCFVLARDSKFILKKFLEIEPSGINCLDSDGHTMLMLTVSGKKKVFDFLLKYRQDVNLLNDDGDNILHFLLLGYLSFDAATVQRILDLGIDINAPNSTGQTPLTLAIKRGKNSSIIKKMLNGGATLPPPDEDGKTIVMHAMEAEEDVFKDKVEVLRVLFQYGADASAKDKNGHNAMYYIISECIPNQIRLTFGINSLEEILIMLLECNCEVQGLDRLHEKNVIMNSFDDSIHRVLVSCDVIALFIFYDQSIKLLKELINRGLYSKAISNPYSLSPLSVCLLYSSLQASTCRRILDTAKELILLGMDVSQRIWHGLSCPGYIEPLEYKHRTRAEYQAAVARELDIPDVLFFAANMWIPYYDAPDEFSNHDINVFKLAMEEVLRLLLRFWPHPPLLLMLLRVDPVWCPSLITTSGLGGNTGIGLDLIMEVLVKIGGPLPLGTRYNTILKSALQRMAERNDLCKPILNMLSEPDGGIPTLRNLTRAAFRAAVKKTCPTGLDFSEYRVLCQGEMVPLPEKIVKFLEFRV